MLSSLFPIRRNRTSFESGCRVEPPVASILYERDGDRPFFCANIQNGVVAFSAELCFFRVRGQEHLACLLIGHFVAGREDLLPVRSQNTGELCSIVRFQGIDKCNDRILRSSKCRLSRGSLFLRASKDNPQGHDQAECPINEFHVRSLHHRRRHRRRRCAGRGSLQNGLNYCSGIRKVRWSLFLCVSRRTRTGCCTRVCLGLQKHRNDFERSKVASRVLPQVEWTPL